MTGAQRPSTALRPSRTPRCCPLRRPQVVRLDDNGRYGLEYKLKGQTVVSGPAKFCWESGDRTKNFWLSCYVMSDGNKMPLRNLRSMLPLTNREECGSERRTAVRPAPRFAPAQWPEASLVHHDVVVLGAGVAGLSCARELRRAGVDAAILEARPRVGGRIHNEELAPGVWVRWGAQYVRGGCTDDNPLYRFMAEHGGFQLYPTGSNLPALDLDGTARPTAVVREKWLLKGKEVRGAKGPWGRARPQRCIGRGGGYPPPPPPLRGAQPMPSPRPP